MPRRFTLLAAGLMFLVNAGCGSYGDFTLPATNPVPDANFHIKTELQPVLPRGDLHDALNPSVLKNGGVYYNYYSEFDGHAWRTALATSANGHAWVKLGTVLSPDPNTWEGDYIAANGSALFDRGQWAYWYQAGPRDVPRLGLARSSDGRSWAKLPRPVMEPGPRGSWDERGVADPYVVKLAGYFYVYYLGQNRARQQQIGLARSHDGRHWEKLRSNPVLTIPWPGSGTPDENGLGEPAVFPAKGWYWMIYTGRDAHERRSLIVARSKDGVHWTRTGQIVRGDATWNQAVLCDPTVWVEDDGRIRLWFGGGDRARPDENIDGQIGEGWIE
jgi:predicted GH43/DUF377 family glycosyl hydrolase